MTSPQTIQPLAIGVEDAARAIGVSRSVIYEIIATGDLPSFKMGRRRMVLAKELEVFVNRKASENAR